MVENYPLKERLLFWFCGVTGVSVDRAYRSLPSVVLRRLLLRSSGSPVRRPR